MKKGILFSCAIVFSWGCAAASADYRFEGALQYSEGDGDNVELEATSVVGTLYLGVVSTKKVPLAEAGFLSRQSYARYSYLKDEAEQDAFAVNFPGQRAAEATDVDRHVGEFMYISKASGWFGLIGGSFVDGDAPSNGDIDGESFRFGFGRYVTPSTAVQIFFERSEQDVDSTIRTDCGDLRFCFDLSISNQTETETDSVGVLARHVGHWSSYNFAVQGMVQYVESDIDLISTPQIDEPVLTPILPITPILRTFRSSISTDAWQGSVDFTWYLNSALGLTAGVAVQEVASDTNTSYRLGAGWFVHPNVELRALVSRTNADGPQGDLDQFVVGITGRF